MYVCPYAVHKMNSFRKFALFVILVPSAMAQNGWCVYVFHCWVFSFISSFFALCVLFILLFRLISFRQRASLSADRCDAEIPKSFGMQIQYYLIYNIRTVIQRSLHILYVDAFPVRFMYMLKCFRAANSKQKGKATAKKNIITLNWIGNCVCMRVRWELMMKNELTSWGELR